MLREKKNAYSFYNSQDIFVFLLTQKFPYT